ncbi:MAG TPA: C40 family peptidase [Flavisolibacter sp.]|nr:C40 family peptidase [Flavisolibacter sp.]
MKTRQVLATVLCLAGISGCIYLPDKKGERVSIEAPDSLQAHAVKKDSLPDTVVVYEQVRDSTPASATAFRGTTIDTRGVPPGEVVGFARTLLGVPYKYASADPKSGFDCSGFITYVFGHFGIIVPRSSIDFTEVGKEVAAEAALPGDLVLFTGTDSTERFVGHMGLVVSNSDGKLEFIHSTSGKAYGVTITPLNDYYRGRYMKTVRIF